jgi:hypothetical protein
MKLRRTGVVLACINAGLISIIVLGEFAMLAGGNKTGGWTMIYPLFWNLPVSFLLMPLLSLKLPEWTLGTMLIVLGSAQWYVIGHGREVFVVRLRKTHPKKLRDF